MSGQIVLDSGNLQLSNTDALGNVSQISMANGSLVSFLTDFPLETPSGSPLVVTLGSGDQTFFVESGRSVVLNEVTLVGSGNFVKTGDGSFDYFDSANGGTGTLDFTGETKVTAGSLQVSAAKIASSSVNCSGSGTSNLCDSDVSPSPEPSPSPDPTPTEPEPVEPKPPVGKEPKPPKGDDPRRPGGDDPNSPPKDSNPEPPRGDDPNSPPKDSNPEPPRGDDPNSPPKDSNPEPPRGDDPNSPPEDSKPEPPEKDSKPDSESESRGLGEGLPPGDKDKKEEVVDSILRSQAPQAPQAPTPIGSYERR